MERRLDLGKAILFTNLDEGMVYDGRLCGGMVTFGKDLKFSIAGGRTSDLTREWGSLVEGVYNGTSSSSRPRPG